MAEKYYNLEMEGTTVKEKLNQVADKLNIDSGNATNLKVTINSETDDENYVANHGYVSSTISKYVKLNNGNLTVGEATLNLDSTYLQNTNTKQLKLADNSQVDFGTKDQVLTSAGAGNAPVWVNTKEISIIESNNDDSNDESLNGIVNITVDEADTHRLIVTKDSFIKTADLTDATSPIGSALAAKVDLSTLYGEAAVLISKPNGILHIAPEKENQVLKTIKKDSSIWIVWENEKAFALNVVEDDSSDNGSTPEDATDVVSTLHYEEPTLSVHNERTVNYDAYKAFEASVSSLLDQKAAKIDLENYATKDELGDQFTIEFDSVTKTLTIIRK